MNLNLDTYDIFYCLLYTNLSYLNSAYLLLIEKPCNNININLEKHEQIDYTHLFIYIFVFLFYYFSFEFISQILIFELIKSEGLKFVSKQ